MDSWPETLKPRTIVFAVVGVLVFVAVERFAKVLYSHAIEPSFRYCASSCKLPQPIKPLLAGVHPQSESSDKMKSFLWSLAELAFVLALLCAITYAVVYLIGTDPPKKAS